MAKDGIVFLDNRFEHPTVKFEVCEKGGVDSGVPLEEQASGAENYASFHVEETKSNHWVAYMIKHRASVVEVGIEDAVHSEPRAIEKAYKVAKKTAEELAHHRGYEFVDLTTKTE